MMYYLIWTDYTNSKLSKEKCTTRFIKVKKQALTYREQYNFLIINIVAFEFNSYNKSFNGILHFQKNKRVVLIPKPLIVIISINQALAATPSYLADNKEMKGLNKSILFSKSIMRDTGETAGDGKILSQVIQQYYAQKNAASLLLNREQRHQIEVTVKMTKC